MNTGRENLGGAGADNTSAIAFAGSSPAGNTVTTELWNGTNWTEVNDLNTARGFVSAGAGTATAALTAGGSLSPVPALTELWNGTNWTEVNDLNSGISGSGVRGISTSALNVGGYDGGSPGQSAKTESWN